jgi:hypothetical protein
MYMNKEIFIQTVKNMSLSFILKNISPDTIVPPLTVKSGGRSEVNLSMILPIPYECISIKELSREVEMGYPRCGGK